MLSGAHGMHMNTSIPMKATAFLLCFQAWAVSHAAASPLDGIDSRLIFEHFPLTSLKGVDSQGVEVTSLPGCRQAKSFQVLEANMPGQIIVAICKEGEFGPGNIEAVVARQVAEARETLKKMPAPVAQAFLAGAEPIDVPLGDGNRGKALTLPIVAHGLLTVPLAYAVSAKKDSTIMVQAYLSPNDPRNLNQPIAALLQAVYTRTQQSRD